MNGGISRARAASSPKVPEARLVQVLGSKVVPSVSAARRRMEIPAIQAP